MGYQIGDKVIHWTYGLGEVVHIEEKIIQGSTKNCYVVRTTPDLMIWIPINESEQHSLRIPTLPEDFTALFAILSAPGESLSEDRALRRDQLLTLMHDGQLASICRVVRDLTHYKRHFKINDQERSILERAVNSLLTEWTYSLGVPVSQAHQAMAKLLGE